MSVTNSLPTISVVTPTLRRPREIAGLCENLSQQTVLPHELILVDGAPADELATEQAFRPLQGSLPFASHFVRQTGGTAVQRNAGIDRASGEFIAFIDDDIRLEKDFFAKLLAIFADDVEKRIGGITGSIPDQHLDPATSKRWQLYRRLKLFTTYEPSHYDFESGYPINRYLQPPHNSIREIDFMGVGCSLWRREVTDAGLRFSHFFTAYGLAEDAHFALRAAQRWKLLEAGAARCEHLLSSGGRLNARQLMRKTAPSYRYIFMDIVPARTWRQEFRFWRVQFVEVLTLLLAALFTLRQRAWLGLFGKLEGIWIAARISSQQVAQYRETPSVETALRN